IMVWGAGNVPRLSTRTVYSQVPLNGFGSTDWEISAAGMQNLVATNGGTVLVEVTQAVRENAQVTGLRAEVHGGFGTHSATPQFMPKLRLYRLEKQLQSGSLYTAQLTLVASVDDSSAPASSAVTAHIEAYESLHLIELTLGSAEAAFQHRGQNLSTPFDMYRWFAGVTGESGTGAQTGLNVKAIAVKQTLSRLEP